MKENIKKTLKKIKMSSLYFLFILLIGLTLAVYTLSNFSEENNMKNYYKNVLLENNNIPKVAEQIYDVQKENCLKGATEQFIQTQEGNKSINCEVILSSTKKNYGDKIIENVLFKEQYEKTYTCTFVQCIMNKDTMSIIFSKQGHFYLNNIKLFLILGTVIGGLLLLISFDKVRLAFKTFGSVFFFIGSSYFINKFLKFGNDVITDTTSALTNPLGPILLTLFIVGTFLIVFSIFIDKKETWSSLLEKIIGRY